MCLDSVRTWADAEGFDYQFVGDEIFDLLPGNYRKLAEGRMSILTDLGRLLLIRRALAGLYARALWFDADVLVFEAQHLTIPLDVGHAFSREIWVQTDKTKSNHLRVYRNIHNAVCLFEQDDVFLDFYIHACKRIVDASQGSVPNQIVGPKFLTALHNIVNFSLIDSVGMLSPRVIRDVARGGGEAFNLFASQSELPLGAVNLCLSLFNGVYDGIELSAELMNSVCLRLQKEGLFASI